MKAQKGFTLIEVMITVAIVAILAAIAMPVYSDYVIRGKIPDATSGLANRRIQAEQYFQDNRTYVNIAGFTNIACVSDISGKNFDFSCTAGMPTATQYTIQAVGKGSMAGFTYTINEQNTRATVAVKTGWVNPATSCGWVVRKDGSC